MGLFGKRSSREIDLALNHLNQILITHFQDWEKSLESSLSAEACSQKSIDELMPAFRSMWIECHRRALVMLLEARENYILVSIKTPQILQVLSSEELEQATRDQMKRMGELMGLLTRNTCDLQPAHRTQLVSLMEEPEIGAIRAEAKRLTGIKD